MNLTIEHFEYGAFDSPTRVIHKKMLPYLILVHTVAGEYRVNISGRKWLLPAGVSFVIPPNIEVEFEHVPAAHQPMKSLWAHITSVVDHAYDWADFFQLPVPIHGEASFKIGEILRVERNASSNPKLAEQAAIMARAYDLLSIIASEVPEKSEKETSLNVMRLATLVRFMRQHLDQLLSIDDLAKSVNLSRSHLHDMVKTTTGKTPHRMLLELRVNEAAKRLVHPDVKIEQVARDCGFACPFHFSKTFKSIKKTSPSEYRAKAISALAAYRNAG